MPGLPTPPICKWEASGPPICKRVVCAHSLVKTLFGYGAHLPTLSSSLLFDNATWRQVERPYVRAATAPICKWKGRPFANGRPLICKWATSHLQTEGPAAMSCLQTRRRADGRSPYGGDTVEPFSSFQMRARGRSFANGSPGTHLQTRVQTSNSCLQTGDLKSGQMRDARHLSCVQTGCFPRLQTGRTSVCKHGAAAHSDVIV